MVMTVLMHDARSMLSHAASHACTKGELEEVLFADDTLLISCCGSHLEEYMAAVAPHLCTQNPKPAQLSSMMNTGKMHRCNAKQDRSSGSLSDH